ncbi:hypothetical protein ACSAZL_09545 [Methanosarcina sp. T3]
MREAVMIPLAPEELEDYLGITKTGAVEMGYTEDRKLELAWLISDT